MAHFWIEAHGGGWRIGAEVRGVRMCSRRLFGSLRECSALAAATKNAGGINRLEWFWLPLDSGPAWALKGGGGPLETTTR